MNTVAQLPRGTADAAIARLFPAPDPHIHDPVGWVRDKLQGYLWSKQREILEACRDYRYVAVQSAHSTGKSYSASCAGAWWLDVHKLGEAFLVTTAPSWPQVEAILWREIRRRHREGGLPGRITLDCQWHMGTSGKRGTIDEELIAMGRKPADYDEYTFQGIHARYFMAILDEAGGVPEWLWNAILSLATNDNSRILAIGNPDDPGSHFAQICKPGSGWHVIKISAFDSPNFTDEKDDVPPEILEQLVSEQWVDDRRLDWGEGSPIWVAKIEGEFPDISDEYLISPALLQKAYDTHLSGLERGRYGIDIARMGVDKSVIYRNRGGVIRHVKSWGKKDTMESVGECVVVFRKHGAKQVPATVDIIGLGAGVFDRLRELGFEVAGFQGSQRAFNPRKFKNRRSEVWWTFRELMEEGLIDLDPDDLVLAAHLGSVKWGVDSAGRIFVEAKDDLRSRGLPSPDHADSAVMSTTAMGSVGELLLGENRGASLTGDLLQKVM